MNSICCIYDVVPCAHTISFTFHLSVAMQKSTKSKNEHVVNTLKTQWQYNKCKYYGICTGTVEDVVVYWLVHIVELRKHKHIGSVRRRGTTRNEEEQRNVHTHTRKHTNTHRTTVRTTHACNPTQGIHSNVVLWLLFFRFPFFSLVNYRPTKLYRIYAVELAYIFRHE